MLVAKFALALASVAVGGTLLEIRDSIRDFLPTRFFAMGACAIRGGFLHLWHLLAQIDWADWKLRNTSKLLASY